MIEERVTSKYAVVYFIALATLMYYFLEEYIIIGTVITLRHLFALLIILSGFVCFLCRPRICRGITALRSALVVSAPLLVMIVFSLLIWLVNRTDPSQISRGVSYYLFYMNQASAAFAAAVFLYLFGEKGVWYNLIALLLANLAMLAGIILEHGPNQFFRELWVLITSFAGTTGNVIRLAEIHELAFCTGLYTLYMLLRPRKKVSFWLLFGLTFFCFLVAFKRISIVAIAAALLLGWLLLWLDRRGQPATARRGVQTIMLLSVAVLIGYIGLVRGGVFQWMERAGINTTGRAEVYDALESFYQFSPAYLGRGMGFMTYLINGGLTLSGSTGMFRDFLELEVSAIHNDFLQFYIDLGFFGYIAWLLATTVLRTHHFGKNGHTGDSIVVMAILLFLIVVSSTDNTLNYQLFNTVSALLIMAPGFDLRVKEQEDRLLGRINNP